ncbi:MAG: hypothetical protein LKI39_02730 [Bacteroides sp.]|jgi:small-conductance mechanosensitive channel|nr:hypothetical protein [Bacteroides sp.]
MEELLKNFWAWLVALLLAAFQPLSVALLVLMCAWTINILIGIAADKNQGEDFKLKKALSAAAQLGLIFAVLFIISLATTGYGEYGIAATIAKWGTWIVSYFYVTNVFRNATKLWPNSKVIAFIYSFLTTEAFGYIKSFFKMKGGTQ